MEMDLYLKNINQEIFDRIPRLEDAVAIDEVYPAGEEQRLSLE